MKRMIASVLGLSLLSAIGFTADNIPQSISWAAVAQDSETDQSSEAEAEAEADISRVAEMALGDENAPIELIEYSSFTCPHCASFHQGTFAQIKENYIDTGKVRFISREVYFDRFGLWAGMVARCSGDTDRYFGIVDLIFEKQRDWIAQGEPETITQNLRTLGKTAGLTDEQLDQCLNDEGMAKAMIAVFQKNMEEHPIKGTPAFFINGEAYSNMSYADFAKTFDEKMDE